MVKKLILFALFLLLPAIAFADVVSFKWLSAPGWYDSPNYTRVAVYVYMDGSEICRAFDWPGDRAAPYHSITCTIPSPGIHRPIFYARAHVYNGGRWRPNTAYSPGNRLSPFLFDPVTLFSCIQDGTSAQSQADWTNKSINSGTISDTGSGTVLFPVPGHGWRQGDTIKITGTTNYDGEHVLPAQTNGDADHLEITAAYVAEDITGDIIFSPVRLSDPAEPSWEEKHAVIGQVTDTGSGTVLFPVSGHGWRQGDTIKITGTTNYDGEHVLPAQTNGDADHLEITAAYVAEDLTDSVLFTPAILTDGSVRWRRFVDLPGWIPGYHFGTNRRIRPLKESPGVFFSTPTTPHNIPDISGDVTDTGSGTVLFPVPGHGFAAGDMIMVTGSTNYNGYHTLPDQVNGDADHIEITAEYVAETLDNAFITAIAGISGDSEPDWASVSDGGSIVDGTITWTRGTDGRTGTFSSAPSRKLRILSTPQGLKEQRSLISGKAIVRCSP